MDVAMTSWITGRRATWQASGTPRGLSEPSHTSQVQVTVGPVPPWGFKPIVFVCQTSNHVLKSKVRNLRGAALLTELNGSSQEYKEVTSFIPKP